MKQQLQKRIQPYDMLAVAVCAVMFGYFFVSVRFGFRVPDESFYLSVAQRFAKGDRPLVDEWQLSQLSALFLVPLYQLFHRLTGSTAGIILFMRQVFLLVNFACYWFFYKKLRAYRYWAVIAVGMFCGYIPSAVFALNYYTMTLRLLLAFCLVLLYHPGERPSVRRLLMAGILLSAAVVNEPPLALLYVVYSIAVLVFECIKKRKPSFSAAYGFVINRRHWLYLSLSVAVCAGIFFTFLCFKSGVGNLLSALPELLTDSEYDFSANGNVRGFLINKLSYAGSLFGRLNLGLSVLLCAAAVWHFKIRKQEKGREVVLLLSLLLLLSCCGFPVLMQLLRVPGGLRSTFHLTYYVSSPLPLFAFGLINYLLCRQKDRRLFVLWIVGLLSSLCVDSFSDITFGIFAILCVFPCVFCFAELLRERSMRKKELSVIETAAQKKKSEHRLKRRTESVMGTICAFAFGLFVVWTGANVYFEGKALFAEQIVSSRQQPPMTMQKVTRGPHKGLYTVPAISDAYDELLKDLDTLKENTGGPFYVDPPDAAAFLYLDAQSANCCSWNSRSARDRQVRYFTMHPEKQPEAMYWISEDSLCLWSYRPEQSALLRELSSRLCDGEQTEGNRGLLVRVRRWKDLSDPALTEWLDTHPTRF